jgi:hypothetical protein
MFTKYFFSILTVCLAFSGSLSATSSFLPEDPGRLVIQNRILAKVENTTISVLDVSKKMEVFLNKNYPQYAKSPTAKYQYFSAQWKDTLLQMIDHELILADAEKMELKITDSEVRETLFEKFGPNVMATLDTIGISYEEAKAMIHSDLVVQKMMWFKVHAKALSSVNTQDIRLTYHRYCEKNPAKEEWQYQVLSIRASDEEIAKEIAKKASELCQNPSYTLSEISEALQSSTEEIPENQKFTLSVSDPVTIEGKNLSHAHKEVLNKLAPNQKSEPVKQTSRAKQEAVYRIFHLQNHIKIPVPTLKSLYDRLHDQLVQEAAERESRIYLSKLRERYGFDAKSLEETIPQGFQPFSLQ